MSRVSLSGGALRLETGERITASSGLLLFETVSTGPSTITGSLTATMPAAVASATGTVVSTIEGTVVATMAPVAASITGEAYTVLEGSVAASAKAVLASITGTVAATPSTITGTVAAAAKPVVASIGGTVTAPGLVEGSVTAAAAAVQASLTAVAYTSVEGAFAIGLPTTLASASVVVLTTVEAQWAVTLSAVASSADGIVVDPGDMSNYTKLTDFAVKDSLDAGDPSKRVSGVEIDAEFDAIQVANNSKANIASPTFTGTVTIPDLVVTTVNGRTAADDEAKLDTLEAQAFEDDKASGTITRESNRTVIYRQTAAAVAYTMEADSTAAWAPGDVVEIVMGNGTDVTVTRAGSGQFTLPDGTTDTSIQATVAGTIYLLNPDGDDNWTLIQQ